MPPLQEEHFYDPQSGSGYLAWRLMTVQRNTSPLCRKLSTSITDQDSPKRKREFLLTDMQLLGEDCHEVILFPCRLNKT
ncbi:hypothetical protein QTP70_020381 [Hemibagrus guttatus]|uniref:Uncharacterized protein n=1 Tax=Hemibagrus guttatus TaxID=175788 RepID=A0AAE0PQH7_9TELE|nr:hypothetical protein QTP70_020381 [Hemibagrus guttatus]